METVIYNNTEKNLFDTNFHESIVRLRSPLTLSEVEGSKAELPRIIRGNSCLTKGFTFVELMLVVVLIAVIVVLSAPRVRSTFGGQEVLNFAKKTAALMRYAQSKAIAEGENIYLGYKEENKGRSFFLAKYDANQKIELDERYRLNVSGSIKIDAKYSSSPPEPPKDVIFIFNPDSSITSGEIIISNDYRKFKLTASKGGIGRVKFDEILE